MTEEDANAGCAMAFTVSLILGGVTFLLGLWVGIKQTREAAIEAGAARWTIDSRTGDKSFQFKEKE